MTDINQANAERVDAVQALHEVNEQLQQWTNMVPVELAGNISEQHVQFFTTLYRPLTAVDDGNLVAAVPMRANDIVAISVGTLVSHHDWHLAVGRTRAYRRERESFYAVRTDLLAPQPPATYVYFRTYDFPVQQPLLHTCQSNDTAVNARIFIMGSPYSNDLNRNVLLIVVANGNMPQGTVINIGPGVDGRDNRDH